MYDHSEEKLANLDFCLKLADLRFVIDLEEVVMNGVEVAGGLFDPEVCVVHWREKEKNRICR